jgi:3-hydroxyisobutyrate dehydrogenase
MLSIINEGACGNGITNINSILNNSYLPLLHSNTLLGLETGQGSRIRTPLIHPLYDSYAAAQEGLGDEDVMAIITSLRNK